MAVEVHYVVVRNGEEKMKFTNKKEADAYDKMLDLADSLGEWLQQAPVTLEEDQREGLGFFLAEHKETLLQLLRGAVLQEPIKKPTKAKTEKLILSSQEESQSATDQAA